MEKYMKVTICEDPKTVIKIKEDYSHYSCLKPEQLLKEIEDIKKMGTLKLGIQCMLQSLGIFILGCAPLPIFIATGIFGNPHYPLCTVLSPFLAFVGLIGGGGTLIFEIPDFISEVRENHINKKTKKKIEKLKKKGLLKEYIIEPKEPILVEKKEKDIKEPIKEELTKKEPSIRDAITYLEKEKFDLLHRSEHPTKEIEYEEIRHTVEGEKSAKRITVHSPRYESYKEFIIAKGGDEKLFDLPAVNNVIDYIIKYGTFGRPIYYKNPNEDGTFDICGRMGGPSATLVYKMEYCHDDNPEHFIVLKKYEQRSHDDGNFYYIDGCFHNKIYINKEGNIIEETDEIKIPGFEKEGFLSELKEKKLIKSMI